MKKKKIGLIILTVLLFCLTMPVTANAVSKSQRNKICKAYMKQYLKLFNVDDSLLNRADEWEIDFYDVNKDGVMEMIIQAYGDCLGMTGQQCLVYSYRKGKVVKCHSDFTGLQAATKKAAVTRKGKYLVFHGRLSGNAYEYTAYKMNSKRKLIKAVSYRYVYAWDTGKITYYRNNKKISKKTFNKWIKPLKKISSNRTWENRFWYCY